MLNNAQGQRQQIRLQLSEHIGNAISKVRLDLADKPGCLVVSKLECLNRKGQSIWTWDFDFGNFKNVSQMEFFQPNASHPEVCMLSTGTDPQFELSLPTKALRGLSKGGAVLVELSTFV